VKKVIIIILLIAAAAVVFLTVKSKDNITSISKDGEAVSADVIYKQAVSIKKKGKLLEAKEVYQDLLSEHGDFEDIEKVQEELESLNLEIIFSNTETPQTVMHEVKSGDTLGKLAKQYGTTVDLIKKNNRLSSDVIRLGQRLRIWKGTFNIFIDKSQNILILKSNEEVIKVYVVATGENNITPVGDFTITTKLIDPVWYKSGAIIPPESPQNVLGSRWLGFDLPGYGIHGTIEPETMGQQVTAGCVRMRNQDVEELYSLVPTGAKVKVVD